MLLFVDGFPETRLPRMTGIERFLRGLFCCKNVHLLQVNCIDVSL